MGIIGTNYVLTVPPVIDFGIFSSEWVYYKKLGGTVSVLTNDVNVSRITVTVKDSKTDNPGKMTLGEVPTTEALDLPLIVVGDEYTVVLAATEQLLVDVSIPTIGTPIEMLFAVEQEITSNDLGKPSGVYSLTMVFTATFSA